MSTGTTDRAGYFHQLLLHDGEDELLDALVTFVEDGLAAQEPVLVVLHPRSIEAARARLGEPAGLVFQERPASARPARLIRDLVATTNEHLAAGATGVRIIGQVPYTGADAAAWEPWCRYEAALNHACGELPLWGVCAYDRPRMPDEVLIDLHRTHPYLRTRDADCVDNDRYIDAARFLRTRPPPPATQLEAAEPFRRLWHPLPADVRRAILAAADDTSVPSATVDALVLAVSEAVTNAHEHGQAPIAARVWRDGPRLVVTVADGGDGPDDPFVGLLPRGRGYGGAGAAASGAGLWLAHQLVDVTHRTDEDGHTVVLTAP
jgi:anti-sigma regulatory factor (Ser/Thr protein kinase)